jgi:hypothetical protein
MKTPSKQLLDPVREQFESSMILTAPKKSACSGFAAHSINPQRKKGIQICHPCIPLDRSLNLHLIAPRSEYKRTPLHPFQESAAVDSTAALLNHSDESDGSVE